MNDLTLVSSTVEGSFEPRQRRKSGVMNLSRLKPKHKNILALHLKGYSNDQIAREASISPVWVSSVLTDPLSVEFINNYTASQEQEFHALRGLANDSVRDALRSGIMGHRLRAAKMFYERADVLNEKSGKGPATAEDIAQELMRNLNINVQVNVNDQG